MSPKPIRKKSFAPKTADERSYAHAEKMLLRARRKAARAAKLVTKWEEKFAATKRARVLEKQTVLWSEQDWNTEAKPCAASLGDDKNNNQTVTI